MKVLIDRDKAIRSLTFVMWDTAELKTAIEAMYDVEPEPETRPRPNAIVQTILETPPEQLDEYIASLSDEKYKENAFYIICQLIDYIKKGE